MENSGIRRFATERTLFLLSAAIMLLMPALEIVTEICCNYSRYLVPSFYQPFLFGAFGVLGTVVAVIFKYVELTAPGTRGKWYHADLFYLILILFMIISAVFSTNPGQYSFGYIFISENPTHFLGYFFMLFAGSRIRSFEYRRKLVFVLLVVEAVHGVFAFFQTFNIKLTFNLLTRHSGAAYGLLLNSNHYGGFSVFMLACVSGVFIFSEIFGNKKVMKIASALFAGFVFYTMMGSRARLAWVGFVVMIVFYLVSGLVMLKSNIDRAKLKRYFIRFFVLCAVFAAVFTVTFLFTDYITEAITRTQMEVDGIYDCGIGSDRLLVWQCGLESVPKHWATGIGLDNYKQVFFEKYGDVYMDFYVDEAHNELLHVLVTQGVFAFAAYVFIYIRTVVINVKKVFTGADERTRSLNWIFMAMFVTYLAQSMLCVSITNVAPHFWLVLGLLNTCDRPLNNIIKNNI